ncbi:MAG: glutamate--tRNA ligase [Robiginitomaculum sp.]|nr:MAG: glutamate--tRNA ligase [Robiginitomaculum sp.]
MSDVITRFAPSPTGYLHIGGARTALFNWLYARAKGGKFLLRVEDTDRARSTGAATTAIVDGMHWLGLDHDGDILYQSQQADRHCEIARELLENGGAYRCYMSPDEVSAERETARTDGRAFRSPWRDQPQDAAPEEMPFVVRLKAPREGKTIIDDQVQGAVTFGNTELDDLILLRADGTPTYMLAVVVDDHDMQISHVIRGDDHLVNAARQTLIYKALDWPVPVFAHIPLIHGPDGKKLSKRHGALGIAAYRDMGYLPEAMRNYLVRLGWAHKDMEIASTEELLSVFDFAGMNKAPSRLDFDKMASINAHYLHLADNERLADLVLAHIKAFKDWPLDNAAKARVRPAMEILKYRAKTISDLAEQAYFLIRTRPISLTGKVAKPLKGDAMQRLGRLQVLLTDNVNWTADSIGECLQRFAEQEGVGFGKVGQPLRAVLTGGVPAPDLGVSCALLGKDETLARLDDALAAAPLRENG